jgi:hypothetical protein
MPLMGYQGNIRTKLLKGALNKYLEARSGLQSQIQDKYIGVSSLEYA